MSKKENPEKVLKKMLRNGISDHNALVHQKNNAKTVSIIFEKIISAKISATFLSSL